MVCFWIAFENKYLPIWNQQSIKMNRFLFDVPTMFLMITESYEAYHWEKKTEVVSRMALKKRKALRLDFGFTAFKLSTAQERSSSIFSKSFFCIRTLQHSIVRWKRSPSVAKGTRIRSFFLRRCRLVATFSLPLDVLLLSAVFCRALFSIVLLTLCVAIRGYLK